MLKVAQALNDMMSNWSYGIKNLSLTYQPHIKIPVYSKCPQDFKDCIAEFKVKNIITKEIKESQDRNKCEILLTGKSRTGKGQYMK